MEIREKNNEMKLFSEVPRAALFSYEGEYYMCLYTAYEDIDKIHNAVNLSTGELRCFMSNVRVRSMEGYCLDARKEQE